MQVLIVLIHRTARAAIEYRLSHRASKLSPLQKEEPIGDLMDLLDTDIATKILQSAASSTSGHAGDCGSLKSSIPLDGIPPQQLGDSDVPTAFPACFTSRPRQHALAMIGSVWKIDR